MLRLSLFLLTLLLPAAAFCVDRAEFDRMMAHLHAGESEPVAGFLQQHRTDMARDPDYYVLLLNHAVAAGYSETIAMRAGPPPEGDEQAIVMTDPDTGEVTGHMAPQVSFDVELIAAAIKTTTEALPAFANRLDIHFGMIAIAGNTGLWSLTGERLVDMLRISREIDNKWIWGPIGQWDAENPQEFMIQNTLSHGARLFRTRSDDADRAFEDVSRALIKYYPKRIYGYANLGVLYLARDKYDQAEKYLNKALEIDPGDEVVLGNLEMLKKLRAQEEHN